MREMIAREVEMWLYFGLALLLIFQWFDSVMNFPQSVTRYPRKAKILLWLNGIIASAYALPMCFMNELFGDPNPLHSWMRVVIGLAYLAVVGYIIKRRGEIRTP